ncbi:MAG TPA: LPS export ABC transporter ATP-binding protein [Thermotogota bacterium]|nr:LPS export ABC transporter ATP-binding protein [Thermotogota bacterium]HRW92219.1 LPS export ABC transporter ATP-binding protein [Thermotogota bacterium]
MSIPTTDHVLRCVELRKKYGKREVVKGASLEVHSHEIVGLLGPNGAGKTTIFRMMLGITIPTQGKIVLNQTEISRLPIHLRALEGITYLPQEVSVFSGLSVWDNIRLVLESKRMDKKSVRHKIEELLAEFGIQHLAPQKADNLSGGEKRRLELARMMTLNPKFILLDEPFSGIDPMTVKDIQRLTIKLKGMGIGVIVTDHNVDDIRRIVDRLYVIHKGTILAQGDPQTVFNDPAVIQNYLGE